MEEANDNQRTKTFLEQVYGKELTDEKVKDYKDRFVKYVSLLVQIDQRIRKKKKK